MESMHYRISIHSVSQQAHGRRYNRREIHRHSGIIIQRLCTEANCMYMEVTMDLLGLMIFITWRLRVVKRYGWRRKSLVRNLQLGHVIHWIGWVRSCTYSGVMMVKSVSTRLKYLTYIQIYGISLRWRVRFQLQGMLIRWQDTIISCIYLVVIRALNIYKIYMCSIRIQTSGLVLKRLVCYLRVWEDIHPIWYRIIYMFLGGMVNTIHEYQLDGSGRSNDLFIFNILT